MISPKATVLAASVSVGVLNLTSVVRPIQDSLAPASQVAPPVVTKATVRAASVFYWSLSPHPSSETFPRLSRAGDPTCSAGKGSNEISNFVERFFQFQFGRTLCSTDLKSTSLWYYISSDDDDLTPVVTKATVLAASISIGVFHLTPVVRPIQDSLVSESQLVPLAKNHT